MIPIQAEWVGGGNFGGCIDGATLLVTVRRLMVIVHDRALGSRWIGGATLLIITIVGVSAWISAKLMWTRMWDMPIHDRSLGSQWIGGASLLVITIVGVGAWISTKLMWTRLRDMAVHDRALGTQWIGGACLQAGGLRDESIARSG